MNELAFTMTNDVITVLHNGKTHLVRRGAPNFVLLRDALVAEDWEAAAESLTPAKAVFSWAKGRIKVEGDKVLHDDEPIPGEMSARVMEMASRGEDPTSLLRFWERLKLNPSWRSVQQLYPFLKQKGIPLTKDGTFLAYKSVTSGYLDHHTGTVKNLPGTVVSMERNKISDDPNQACHYGLHVGALEYASSFGGSGQRIVICEVDPADVVCVPYDSSQQKMRVCKYKVVGNHNGEFMPSTSVDDDFDVEIDEELEEDGNTRPAKAEAVELKVPKKYAKLQAMDSADLFEQTMERLRDYATNGLKIVGASKIPGGKAALLKAILDVRRS